MLQHAKLSWILFDIIFLYRQVGQTLYIGDECLQKCPPFFEEYEGLTSEGEGQELLNTLNQMTEMQVFEPRCIVNIANYAYMSGESLDNIDLDSYQKSLDKSPNSPYYCFETNLNNVDPRWDTLKISDNLCDKYETMMFCNMYWPCVANGMKRVCNNRGIYNCTSKSCQCFDGFINIPIRSRPEDTFKSCDIGINSLFNHTLPQLPNNFIIDGSYREETIKPDQYKLPSTMKLRYLSQAYLLHEYNKTNKNKDTLIIGVNIDYIDWDVSQNKSSLFQYAQTKTTRSNSPGYIAINADGLYQIGKLYWRSNETSEMPLKPGIGYSVSIDIEWYSSRSFITFSSIGKKEIELKFSDIMDISSVRMTWNKFVKINITNNINIMYDAYITIKSSKLDVIEYFKKKYETNTELNPPSDVSKNIKSILESRKITISNRKYGGIIIGEFDYPTKKIQTNAFSHDQVNQAFCRGFQQVLKINIKYIVTEKYKSGGNDMLKIIIFEDEDKFRSIYARLRDEEDPLTGYKSEHGFVTLLQHEMKFVEDQLSISFDSWNVTSSNDLYAAWYEISVFATMNEINSKNGITESNAKLYLNALKQSLFDGFSGIDIKTEVTAPDILRYFNFKKGNPGYKIQAQLKVTADYVNKIQEIEKNAISSLIEISLNTGWGMIDTQNSLANARLSIFAEILVNVYDTGFLKLDSLINIVKDLVSINDQKVNVDRLNTDETSKPNIVKITVEVYLKTDEESKDSAEKILNKIKDLSFAKMINEEALKRNVNVLVIEVMIIYPSKLNNVEILSQKQMELPETNLFMNVTEGVFPIFVDKFWPLRFPVDIFCSEFHTQLQFGTTISFGTLKQYFCIRLTNIIPGKGKVKLKTKLIYLPSKPGSPDSLSSLCDYWSKSRMGEVEPNPSLDEKLMNAGPGIDSTCALLSAGKTLIPDNLPDTVGNIQHILTEGAVNVMDLPDIILDDPRPNNNAGFPLFQILNELNKQQSMNQSNSTMNVTNMKQMYETRKIYDQLPPDAFIVLIAIFVFVILIVIRRRYKQKKMRQEMLLHLEEDMDTMRNIARASKLTAEEYKALYEKAKDRVNQMDFSKYEKRKKRKHSWDLLEAKEKQLEKRDAFNAAFEKENDTQRF